MSQKIISRAEAKAKGLKRYFTGEACKYGHIAMRYTKGRDCIDCCLRYQRENIEAKRERDRAYRKKNREAIRERSRLHRKKNLEAARARKRLNDRRAKGMPTTLFEAPEYCECCGRPPGNKAMSLDHCHESGMFRGWLCGRCNTALGLLGDNLMGVRCALAYLERADLRVHAARSGMDLAGNADGCIVKPHRPSLLCSLQAPCV